MPTKHSIQSPRLRSAVSPPVCGGTPREPSRDSTRTAAMPPKQPNLNARDTELYSLLPHPLTASSRQRNGSATNWKRLKKFGGCSYTWLRKRDCKMTSNRISLSTEYFSKRWAYLHIHTHFHELQK